MGILRKLFGGSSDYDFALIRFRIEDGSNGFIVRRLSDGQKLNWRWLPKSKGLQAMTVVGVEHYPKALKRRAFAPGNRITLKPEPDNPHDSNAIAVYDQSGTHHVGYLFEADCPRIHKKMKEPYVCISMWQTVEQW